MRRTLCLWFATLALLPALATSANAQDRAAIVGTVTDASGAVMPGVTVEASSPALIEKVRTAVSNDQGLFNIANLAVGTYSVTFTLPGFSTFKREDVELSAGFTATVSAQLKVGGLEETVTVSGQSALIDVRNVTQHNTVTQQLIEDLPTGKSLQNLAVLIPGVRVAIALTGVAGGVGQDVGGNVGEGQVRVVVHGSYQHDMPLLFDGMRYQLVNAESARTSYQFNAAAIQEVAMEAGVLTAEQDASGIWTNQIPKTGGNRFSGYALFNYTNHHLQSNNVSPEQVSAGFTSQSAARRIWDYNPSIGGPIIKDRLWFHFAFRYWGHEDQNPGAVFEANPGNIFFTPGAPAPSLNWYRAETTHITAQLTQNQRMGFHIEPQQRCSCGIATANTAFNATTQSRPTIRLYQSTWNWTASNHFLVEAGITFFDGGFPVGFHDGFSRDTYSVLDRTRNITYNAPASWGPFSGDQGNIKAAVTYVTGNHNLKVGLQAMKGQKVLNNDTGSHAVQLRLLNGLADSLVEYSYPLQAIQKLNRSMGFYAQEQWTLNPRVTLNLGARLDYLNAGVPENSLGATRFVGARSYGQLECYPCWWDFDPRLGVAWDVFGNSKTALKVAAGRYVEGITTLLAQQADPTLASVNTTIRTWNNASGQFNPDLDCVLTNPAINGGCGPIQNTAFGTSQVVSHFDPDLLTGFGKRWNNWETSVTLQQQLRAGLSVTGGYFRRWYSNFRVPDNRFVTPSDFDQYCIQAPTDARLPAGVSGQQICGLYDVKPALQGKEDFLVTDAKNLPGGDSMRQVYNGFDLTSTARMGQGSTIQGGVSIGRIQYKTCFVVDSPSAVPQLNLNPLTLPTSRFCDTKPPFQPEVRVLATYPLPWDTSVSATFQSLPGPNIEANLTVGNSAIIGLGRNLASGAGGTVVVPLIHPATIFSDRINQLDFRAAKRFRMGKIRLQGQFDLYNALNANPITALNYTYGPAWLTPINILPGRLFKAGLQLQF